LQSALEKHSTRRDCFATGGNVSTDLTTEGSAGA
jgi:hypothetical protein